MAYYLVSGQTGTILKDGMGRVKFFDNYSAAYQAGLAIKLPVILTRDPKKPKYL